MIPTFTIQLARAGYVADLRKHALVSFHNLALNIHVKERFQRMRIEEKEPMQENESTNEAGYSGSTHDDVRCLIHIAVEEHDERTLRLLIDDR